MRLLQGVATLGKGENRCLDSSQPLHTNCRSLDLIVSLVRNEDAIISTQTLQEFYNAATKKLIASKKDAGLFVKQFSDIIPVHSNTVNDVLTAIDISEASQLSFWDSLILASAKSCGCSTVYSEDLNDGQTVNDVKIVNPFK